jgi:hypothetical protein
MVARRSARRAAPAVARLVAVVDTRGPALDLMVAAVRVAHASAAASPCALSAAIRRVARVARLAQMQVQQARARRARAPAAPAPSAA